MNVFLDLRDAWRNRGDLSPNRKHRREIKRNAAPARWDWTGERAAFRVDAQRRTAAEILRSYDTPTVRGWNYTEGKRCTNPNCWCGR